MPLGKLRFYGANRRCRERSTSITSWRPARVGLSYGFAPEMITRGIAELPAVPGRFERVDEGQPFVVVVDYAHTDDALRNTISVARAPGAEARHHSVRLRRRPRPRQAPADGPGGRRS